MSSMNVGGGNSRPSLIRMFLEADSPNELVGLQLLTNTILMGKADYTDFMFVDGKWYCWFLVDIHEHPEFLDGPVTG